MAELERPECRADPYAFYRRLRESAPVHRDEGWQVWVLSRYADVTALLRDERLSARVYDAGVEGAPPAIQPVAKAVAESHANKVLFVDPPDHTRMRALMHRAFTPRMVARLRPTIQRLTNDLLQAPAERGRLDVIHDLAFPLPALVIAEMLGVPIEDRERFKAWSTDLATDFGIPWSAGGSLLEAKIEAQSGAAALLAYMRDLIARRRDERHDDLLQELIDAAAESGAMSEPELIANSAFLLFAGHETTTNLIGNGLLALLRDPAALNRLREHPELLPSSVEELLRFDAPVQFASRKALVDLDIDGHRIAAGQRIRFCLGAANHDPEQFADPDRLDLARRPNRHLTFSHGIHFCLGAALARLEGEIVFATLLRRFPRLELAAEPRWRPNPDFRGLETLIVDLA
jgi:cytochrome P450